MKVLSIFIILLSLYSNNTLAKDIDVKEFPFMNYKERTKFIKTQLKSTACKNKEFQSFIRELVMTYAYSANAYEITTELNDEIETKRKVTKFRALTASVLTVAEFALLAKLLFLVDVSWAVTAATFFGSGDGLGLVVFGGYLGGALTLTNFIVLSSGLRTAIYFSEQIYSDPSNLTKADIETGIKNGDLVQLTRKSVKNIFSHLDNQLKMEEDQIEKEFEHYEENYHWYNLGWDSHDFLKKWKNSTSSKKDILKQKGSIAFSLAIKMINTCKVMIK